MGLNCYINKLLHEMNNFLIVWLMGMKMSHMTCYNHLVGLQTFDGSHICFRVHIYGSHLSHDMIQCSVIGHDIGEISFAFSHDSHSHGTHKCIESWIHLKIQFT